MPIFAHLYSEAEVTSRSGRVGSIYIRKRLSYALSLADQNLANSNQRQKQSDDRCSLGICNHMTLVCLYFVIGTHWGGGLYIFGVGFCVTRSGVEGSARALVSGMSDRYSNPRFFCIMPFPNLYLQIYNRLVRVAARHKRNNNEKAFNRGCFCIGLSIMRLQEVLDEQQKL